MAAGGWRGWRRRLSLAAIRSPSVWRRLAVWRKMTYREALLTITGVISWLAANVLIAAWRDIDGG